MLLLVRFHVIDRERLQRGTRKSQVRRFGHRFVDVPFVDEGPLHKPHRCSAITAGAMNEGRLCPRSLYRLQELIHSFGRWLVAVEWNMDEADSGFVGSGFF